MPRLELQKWKDREQLVRDFFLEVAEKCCTRSVTKIYNHVSELAVLKRFEHLYAALSAAENLPEKLDPATLAQFHTRHFEMQQTLWRCTVITGFKLLFESDTSNEDIIRLNDLLKRITISAQRRSATPTQTAAAERATGALTLTLNAAFTSAVTILADTAFGPIGPCITAAMLTSIQYAITYFSSRSTSPITPMLDLLPAELIIESFKQCGNKEHALSALERLNHELDYGVGAVVSSAARRGLVAAFTESISRAMAGASTVLGIAARGISFFGSWLFTSPPAVQQSPEEIAQAVLQR